MLGNLRIKRGVAVLSAAGATLALVASVALANGPFAGPHGLVQFCVDTTGDTTGVPGTVRALAILGDCGPDAPLDIQQPFKYSASRDNGPTGVIAPAAVNESTEITILSLKVPAGTYNIEAKTNLRITNKDTVEVEAYLSECDLAYYQGTDPEFDADTTTWTTAPKYGDDIAQVVHNLQAVKTFTSDTTIAIECNVTA